MAPPRARKAVASPKRAAIGLSSLLSLLVLLAGGEGGNRLLQGVDAQEQCASQAGLCGETELCTDCTVSFSEELATCTPYVYDESNECEVRGVAYCCGAEATGDPDKCLVDGATLEYWVCLMEKNGCALSDMPCFTQDFDGDAGVQAGVARGVFSVGATAAAAAAAAAVTVAHGLTWSSRSFLGF